MPGEKLHTFDLHLCRYVFDNIGSYLHNPSFDEYVREQLPSPIYEHILARSNEISPLPSLLLTDQNFEELAIAFLSAPLELDRQWIVDEALHRRSIECAADIRQHLAPDYAQEWAQCSARMDAKLRAGKIMLPQGINIVHAWVDEARRFLQAMGAMHFLPRPAGRFPTPSFPAPSCEDETAKESDISVQEAILETRTMQREMRDLLLSQRSVKEFYTTEEVAEILGRAAYTVREWARKGQIQAEKAFNGRGWLISHAELTRLCNHGPLPEQQLHRRLDG